MFWSVTKLVVIALVILWIVLKWKRRHLQKLSEQLKSTLRPLPFVGHSYLLAGNGEQRMKGLQTIGMSAIKSGGTTSIWHSNKLYIIVADPEVVDVVSKNCLDKDDLMKVFQIVTGDGSVFADVPKWRQRRKLLAPNFNMKILNSYVDAFSAQSSCMVDMLQSSVGKGPRPMWKVVSAYAMDAACDTTLGIQIDVQKNSQHPFSTAVEEMFRIAAARICQPWLHIDAICKCLPIYRLALKHRATVHDFVEKILKEKWKKKEYTLSHHSQVLLPSYDLKPIIEMLMEATEDDVAIREECLVLLGAGSDTSAVGLGYTMLMLARYPEVQEKVYQELMEVVGESERAVQAADLPRLKYLDAVVRESLRLYPPVPIIARKVTKDVLLPSGVTLVPGCVLMLHIWAVHRNPACWGADADRFRPERFLDAAPAHPAAFMPFSYGPRNCLGYQYAMMSLKTAVATLVRRYRLAGAPPLRLKYDLMMRHVHNYSVSIESRK